MTYYTYMLRCTTLAGRHRGKKSIYTGYTGCITSRFADHVAGKGARYTKGKQLELVWTQEFRTQAEAMRRELEIKAMTPRKKQQIITEGCITL